MTTATLGDVAEYVNGAAFKESDWGEHGRRIIRIQNLNDPSKPYNWTTREVKDSILVRPGDLLVSWSASLGVYEWAGPDEAVLNQHIFRVIPDRTTVDKSYLRRVLEWSLQHLESQVHGATMKHLTRDVFLGTNIPLPPIEEQRRIAAVLDAADALRAKRRQTLAKLDMLRSSIVAEQLRRYPDRDPLGDHLSFVTSGSRGWAKFYADSGARFVRTQDVLLGDLDSDDPAFVTPPDNAESRRTVIREGDLLVTITGVVGRVAAAPTELAGAFISQHVAIARPAKTLRPKFAEAFMCSRPGQVQLERAQYGQTKPGLNLHQIRDFALPVPSLEEQDALLRELEFVDVQIRMARHSSARFDELFASLQQRAFRDEL